MHRPTSDPSPQPSPTRGEGVSVFSINVRIYYEDTDVGGVVYYANYLRYLERARTEWLRAAGYELDQIQRDLLAIFVVRRVEADYHLPAKLGDIVTVTCAPTKVGHSKLIVQQRVERNGELLLAATVTLAFIASDLTKPIAMPAEMRAAMAKTMPGE
ncbi:MAG: tol-pal system-associated acyl-CoA thioesterase [Casimicrobium sp.]